MTGLGRGTRRERRIKRSGEGRGEEVRTTKRKKVDKGKQKRQKDDDDHDGSGRGRRRVLRKERPRDARLAACFELKPCCGGCGCGGRGCGRDLNDGKCFEKRTRRTTKRGTIHCSGRTREENNPPRRQGEARGGPRRDKVSITRKPSGRQRRRGTGGRLERQKQETSLIEN